MIYDLLNGITFNDLGWPLTRFQGHAIIGRLISVISLIPFFMLLLKTKRPSLTGRNVRLSNLLIISCIVMFIRWREEKEIKQSLGSDWQDNKSINQSVSQSSNQAVWPTRSVDNLTERHRTNVNVTNIQISKNNSSSELYTIRQSNYVNSAS